ncbi:endopeptidase La [Pelobacter propionicus]|uniref:Lon protease n=1 Tax=Pelobacter propionicus (strain DSM 2379 / NBRC 103807 / OttBd1) TaxID=338966 RepID=A1ATY0_PELPD|nr:endopeptidase La [Pelobacter propionicus]ABL00801.1 ATP-dependent protease La [Pelobacter propionicus DSM 2379]
MPYTDMELPEKLPVFLQKEIVPFPYMIFPLFVDERDMLTFSMASTQENLVAVVLRNGDATGNGQTLDYRSIGTLCRITKITKIGDTKFKVTMEGLNRLRILELDTSGTVPQAHCELVREFVEKGMVSDALVQSLNALLKISLSHGKPLPDDVMKMIDYIDNPARLSDLVALYVNLPLEGLQELLETTDPLERLKKVYVYLTNEVQRLQVKSEINTEVNRKVGKNQKEYILREQMKHIQDELGEEDARTADMNDLRKRIEEAGLPEDVHKIAVKELKRLERINQASPEYTVSRTYLDYLAGMPWNSSTIDSLDIIRAEEILNEDHYDLKKIKERILEFLAVRSLKDDMKGPVLCFVGPPGVGKTSLGKSIARSLGRKFVRISLGGMRDEAEIRGHRRTYIGALPGRIIKEIFRCGSNNPVFMLDEIDKLGQDFRGDPASALLEVLDPEQNFSFQDHYLDVPFDLSKVMFITTANQLDPIPGPLKDRMEVIRLAGYSTEEKLHIARNFIVRREIEENGLKEMQPEFLDNAIVKIVSDYTREAGVRNMQRTIATICRKVAKEITQKKPLRTPITPEVVAELLGPRKFHNEVAAENDRIGVVTGMAWTESGGDILFVEVTSMPGKAELILTGSLGDVMKESARAALSYIEAHAVDFGIEPSAFENRGIHVHVPSGAIPKDGPSAGVTIVTALVSLLTGKPARRDVAMTGEITLTGRVLAIGGLKEKVLAAHRAGVRKIVAPERNRDDLEDIPDNVRNDLEFIFINEAREALEAAL